MKWENIKTSFQVKTLETKNRLSNWINAKKREIINFPYDLQGRLDARYYYISEAIQKNRNKPEFVLKLFWEFTSTIFLPKLLFYEDVNNLRFLKKETLEGKYYLWKKIFMFLDISIRVCALLLFFLFIKELSDSRALYTVENMITLLKNSPSIMGVLFFLTLLVYNGSYFTTIFVFFVDPKEREEMWKSVKKHPVLVTGGLCVALAYLANLAHLAYLLW